MITIENIDKILAINSQSVEILTFQKYSNFYEFEFVYDNIHSTTFKVHMNRTPDSGDISTYTLKLWDGIRSTSTPLEYQFELKDINEPFALLKYLADVIYDWDIITNK